MSIRGPRTRGPAARYPRRGVLQQHPYTPPQAAPPPSPPPNWRDQIVSLSGLNVLAGIWLIIAPWVLGYSARDPRWNDVVFGIIVGVFALTRALGAYREDWLSWINALIGIWLIVAAFTIDYTSTAGVNDVILGVIVFLLAAGSAEATGRLFPRRRFPA